MTAIRTNALVIIYVSYDAMSVAMLTTRWPELPPLPSGSNVGWSVWCNSDQNQVRQNVVDLHRSWLEWQLVLTRVTTGHWSVCETWPWLTQLYVWLNATSVFLSMSINYWKGYVTDCLWQNCGILWMSILPISDHSTILKHILENRSWRVMPRIYTDDNDDYRSTTILYEMIRLMKMYCFQYRS